MESNQSANQLSKLLIQQNTQHSDSLVSRPENFEQLNNHSALAHHGHCQPSVVQVAGPVVPGGAVPVAPMLRRCVVSRVLRLAPSDGPLTVVYPDRRLP